MKTTLLEQAWYEREETIYKDIFGESENHIYPLSFEIFRISFGHEEIDPRWLNYGVIKYPPTSKRKTWAYVSSGMSNPWETDNVQEYSGLGIEFILESNTDDDWGILAVQNVMAFNILLSAGRYGEKPPLDYGQRIPFSIIPNLSHIVLAQPIHFPSRFNLVSGKVDLLQLVGITQDEFQYAKDHSSQLLIDRLTLTLKSFIVNPLRSSLFQ